jgi:hypothetical protein
LAGAGDGARFALCQRTSISSIILLCRLGDGGIMGKLAAWAEAGADDAMLTRREKAIFGFFRAALCIYIVIVTYSRSR